MSNVFSLLPEPCYWNDISSIKPPPLATIQSLCFFQHYRALTMVHNLLSAGSAPTYLKTEAQLASEKSCFTVLQNF